MLLFPEADEATANSKPLPTESVRPLGNVVPLYLPWHSISYLNPLGRLLYCGSSLGVALLALVSFNLAFDIEYKVTELLRIYTAHS